MDNRKPLPTTVTAVDADLKARADFRGVDEAGRVHYLLGMCEALLADANARIVQLEKRKQDTDAVVGAIMDLELAALGDHCLASQLRLIVAGAR